MPTNVFDPNEFPQFSAVHDRTGDRPDVDRAYFSEGSFAQAADINDAFSIEERKRRAIGDLIAADGDRLSGADVIVDATAGTVFVSAGTIYLLGSPRAVEAGTLTGVPMEGEIEIGVRVVIVPVTAADDAIFYGLVEGTESYGEEGAVRTTMSITWAWEGDGGAGDFYKYVVLIDGQVLSQDAPPTLTGVQRQIAAYDYGAHGNYIVRGCSVKAMGLNGASRIFNIGSGEANVNGFKVIRENDTRFEVPEEPDYGEVNLEPHTFTGAGTTKLRVRRPPIAAITVAIVTKERTVTLIKGAAGGLDALPDDSVQSISLVKRGATTYATPADYTRVGDAVSWAPAGAEPATGESYDVTYRYYDEVVPDSFDSSFVTLSGGVTGTDCFVAYDYKLPRFDRILMASDGTFSYLKGESSPENPFPPAEPGDSLSLSVVRNTWFDKPPVIVNDGTRSITFKRLNQLEARLADTINLALIERLKSSAISRAPGPTLGVFTDPFWDDSYRDLGEAQDAASFEGSLQIGITPTMHKVRLPAVGMLNFTEQRVINQPSVTHCQKINPYQNFTPGPAAISIDPDEDFWTETEEVTLSDQTQVFGTGNTTRVVSTRTNVTTTTEKLRYLRQIPIAFRIEGFGPGEALTALTFDGINVNPGGLVANGAGVITGTFNIPARVAAGRKAINATGGSGAICRSVFVGQGKLETETSQQVTVLQRFQTFQRPDRVWRPRENEDRDDGRDPQAQTFVLPQARCISSVELRFCKIGNRAKPVDIEIVTTGDEGYPTREVVASARINMNGVVANTWHKVSLGMPVYQPANTYLAVVVKTDDPNHSISIAKLGAFDATTQKWVTAQPYTAGDRFDGSNGLSWLLHPDSDISMRINAASFSPASKTINIGTFAVVGISDVVVRASVILPEASTSVVFHVTIGSKTYRLLPDQTLELDAFYTGNVVVKAVLTGNSRVSPILSRDILVAFGKMKASGTYVGRSFAMGNPVRLDVIFSAWLPKGAAITVQADAENDVWTNASLVSSTPIDDGFVELTYRINAHVAPNGGRVKLTITGTPGARPAVADLRAFTF